jgi:hypothetical protein
VLVELSFALPATNVNSVDDAVIGLPRARFVPAWVPLRVTVVLFADWLPAASLART